MKILVVDDEKLLVKGIKFNLENEGYSVDACYDGEEALNMARSENYDLISGFPVFIPKIIARFSWMQNTYMIDSNDRGILLERTIWNHLLPFPSQNM